MVSPAKATATKSAASAATRRSYISATVNIATSAPRLSLSDSVSASQACSNVAPRVTTRTAIGQRRRTTSGSVSARRRATLKGSRPPASSAPPSRATIDSALRPNAIPTSISDGGAVGTRRARARAAVTRRI
jgi:hypothetical protein